MSFKPIVLPEKATWVPVHLVNVLELDSYSLAINTALSDYVAWLHSVQYRFGLPCPYRILKALSHTSAVASAATGDNPSRQWRSRKKRITTATTLKTVPILQATTCRDYDFSCAA
ncbi:hypothetical protein HPB50_029018 [Hyalomma asiaticum]|nr:hypothetical protein HPB50_029018 [Hyalomma asiaticum]